MIQARKLQPSACLTCTPRSLPREKLVAAATIATDINPINRPPLHKMMGLMPGFVPTPEHIAVVTSKYWHVKGVKLTVGFLEPAETALRTKILSHMNAWSTRLNISFLESNDSPMVRISREGSGYWSYVGTDILSIDKDQPTMNLEAFTLDMPDSEYTRVVRHETGHTLGCPHEHMRRELVDKLDTAKTIAFFGETQGWSEQEVRQQVLTPIEDASLWGTGHADPSSIMCYQIPGSITKDGKPILGGTDIDESDFVFMSKVYPKDPTQADPALASNAATQAADTAPVLARLQEENTILKKALGIMARDIATG